MKRHCRRRERDLDRAPETKNYKTGRWRAATGNKSMALDPYSLCPCGSGKKVKFCCNEIVDEMQRILSMRQNNQLHMALQALSQLRKSLKPGHPGEIWVRTTEATILLEDNQLDLAKTAVAEALTAIPDNPQLLALSALTTMIADGYAASRELIDRAFQEASEQRSLLSHLAILLTQHFMEESKIMAARQHLCLAVRYSTDPAQLVERLVAFDVDQSLPYWLRTDYFLKSVEVPEERQADYARARELEICGCYQLAANAFETLANRDPENSDLWYNTALCLAWSGDVQGAIEAFGEAACTQQDFDEAVECETLCQMLELTDPEEGIEVSRTVFRVGSAAKLLTNWEDQSRIVPSDEGDAEETPEIAGVFNLLDRPALTGAEVSADLEESSIPQVLGELTVINADPSSEESAVVLFEYGGRQPLDEQIPFILDSSAGELEQDGESQTISTIPSEVYDLHHHWDLPNETPVHVFHQLERRRWERTVQEVWPNMPLAALDGKTPLEAVGDDENKIELSASINTLEAICDQRGYYFDAAPLREQLKLAAPALLEVSAETEVAMFPLPRLRRVVLKDLTDEQMRQVTQRALATHVSALCYDVCKEALSRSDFLSDEEQSSLYSGLVGLCRNRFDREEALEWLQKGRAFDEQRDEPLEKLVTWDLREASVRAWDPDDEEGRRLLLRLWEHTSVKLPFLRSVLEQLVQTLHIDPPWDGSVIQTADVSSAAAGGVWTPDSEPAQEKSKLWLPGQD